MHAILSASAGQEQLLTELLVSYAKVSLLGCGGDPLWQAFSLELGLSCGQCAILV